MAAAKMTTGLLDYPPNQEDQRTKRITFHVALQRCRHIMTSTCYVIVWCLHYFFLKDSFSLLTVTESADALD